MRKLFQELRRREVFRTAGIYVGTCWIAIEVASVVLPAFDAPEWTLRALIAVAGVGFPITLVLSWIYDITDKGIVVQDDAPESPASSASGRRMDFVAIGILSVALIVSVYLNVADEPVEAGPIDPVSLLIADFDNKTENPLFDGSLEAVLSLGIEGAAFVTAYPRTNALKQARDLSLGDALDEETARLVAVRQDVRMVLAGEIASDADRFALRLRALDPASGDVLIDSDVRAQSAADVLGAINELAADVRKALGDQSLDLERLVAGETVTAGSLEAMKAYATAQGLARSGKDEEAIEYYTLALQADPEMARAWSGWALSAHKLGRPTEAEEKWQRALTSIDRMTERERYRTLGLYYTVITVNYDKAIENYQQLVEKYPADGAANNNLAVLYTFTAQYDRALEQSRQLLKVYPGRTLYHGNHAQYAVYAGDIETARREAQRVVDEDPEFFKSYMILALTELHRNDVEKARGYYQAMAKIGERGRSLADIGVVDIDLYERRYDDALTALPGAIERDRVANNSRGVGTKSIALAQAYAGKGDMARALEVVDNLTDLRGAGQLVPAAEFFAGTGRADRALQIADRYRQQLGPTARAYAGLIDGLVAMNAGEYVEAVDAMRGALQKADLWIVRYYLAQAYLQAGYPAEALSEIETCIKRRGEAGGMFFDDVPTWRYTADLDSWKSRASDAMGQLAAAVSELP